MTINMITPPARLRSPEDLQIFDDATRREFIAMLGAAGLLVACGDDGGSGSGVDTGTTITVSHVGGETTFPTVPSRIVILDDAMLGDVLAFGVVPIGTAATVGGPAVIKVWQDEAGTDDIALVSPDFAPNLEAIAELQPDAIFAMAFQVDEPYWEALQAIAPTIAVETDVNVADLDSRFDEVAMRTFAEVFRNNGAVEDAVDDYEQRVEAIRNEFGDVIDGTVVSLASSFDLTSFRTDIDTGWAGAILADLGFTFPQAQRDDADPDFPIRVEFSAEQTEKYLADSDLIIWASYDRDDLVVADGFPTAPVEVNPLLATLPAVANGTVVTVSNRVWFLRTVRGRSFVLDQLENEILPRLRGS